MLVFNSALNTFNGEVSSLPNIPDINVFKPENSFPKPKVFIVTTKPAINVPIVIIGVAY